MLTLRYVVLGMLILIVAVAAVSCSSESPETKQLYTDAKDMWDDMKRAFLLPKGEERTQMMYKYINEEWDKKIVDKLELYLKDAPSGEFAAEAKTLLEQARSSQELRALSQMRSIAGQIGVPQNQAEVDSLLKSQQMADSLRDTTKTGN